MRVLVPALAIALAASGQDLRLGKPDLIPEVEAKELLRAVCTGPVVESMDEFRAGDWGCASCPQFTDLREGTLDLATVHYGHFTSPGADEAALAMEGCTSHANQFGATVLLARSNGRWKMTWSNLGLITSRCIPVKLTDSRNLLLCESEDMHQGIGDLLLFAVDLVRPAGAREIDLLHLMENMNTCGERLASSKTPTIGPLQAAQYRRIRLDDARLRVEVEYGWRSPLSAENVKACRKAQSNDQPIPAAMRPTTKIYTIEFDFDGRKFSISPAGKQPKALVETFHLDR